MPDGFPTRLARKWCVVRNGQLRRHEGIECICGLVIAAVSEALEEAEDMCRSMKGDGIRLEIADRIAALREDA